jgi:Protein of unknown function (DUF4239)
MGDPGRRRAAPDHYWEINLNSTLVSLAVFACTFCAALAAIFIRARLPTHHVEGDSREVVKLVLGLMATLTALVLGLLISSAHSAYDAQEAELQQLSVRIYQLDRLLVHFGPDAAPLRAQLRQILTSDIARIWPASSGKRAIQAPVTAQMEIETLFEGIVSLAPKTDLQHLGMNHAVELLGQIGETRHMLIEQSQGALAWPFLFVLVSWMTVLFFGFGLIARYNGTVVAALFVGSLSVAAAVMLILEMNQPYGGWIQVSSAPLRDALSQLAP